MTKKQRRTFNAEFKLQVMHMIRQQANQMQCACAGVFVFKDLAHHKDFFRIALEVATHHAVLWYLEFVYPCKTLVFFVLCAQSQQPVVFERRDKVLAARRDEFKVLL